MKANPIIAINRVPSSPDIHLWADYVELLCLVSIDGRVSKADILDKLQEESPLDKFLEDQDNILYDDKTDFRDSKQERKSDDWFGHLVYRSSVFDTNNCYPFEITADGDTLVRKNSFTLEHKLYLFLLIASNLEYVSAASLKSQVRYDFEAVSEAALKKCLPKQAEIYIFGTGTCLSGSKKFKGTFYDKIEALGKELRETVHQKKEKTSPHNSGDGGADLVAWVPMGDSSVGLLCILGQCACSFKEWKDKQASSSPMVWRQKLNFKVPPVNSCFIPFCFRDNTGDWDIPHNIYETILFDRVRLIYLLEDQSDIVQKLPVYPHLEKLISYRVRDLV